MNQRRPVFVTGMGVVCAGASNVAELRALLGHPTRHLQTTTTFPIKHVSGELPVAQVTAVLPGEDAALPRTHRLALMAAREAVGSGRSPDAVVLGTTTGGIATTETALEAGITAPAAYRHHGLDTVAGCLADAFGVAGAVLTVSTACSSAAVALSIAAALLRAGEARTVLCGGVDALCRLTFHGFRQLQLAAPRGCAPLDADRDGMTVGEGAGFLLLEAAPTRPALAQLVGSGLSCDAYHAASPHPEGAGAALAMRRALADAGLEPRGIDYVNLHGTGTPDNDKAEGRAIKEVFGDHVPALSSTKGLTGHPLAAAGGIEAVISVLTMREGLLPANTGLATLDPSLGLAPVLTPTPAAVSTVLSNSFGFGGNNACVIFERAPSAQASATTASPSSPDVGPMRVAASVCLTARGGLDETWAALSSGQTVAGLVPDVAFAHAVPSAFVRRLKRLPRLMLALAQTAHTAGGRAAPPDIIAAGTAWGPLAETQEFLRKLFESGDQFSSPTDFIGSVHNAPAGQIALLLGCQAPNVTCSGGERSFCQALRCASLHIAMGAGSALVVAAEAFEPKLSPLFEPAVASSPLCSDGGAAFVLLPDDGAPGACLAAPDEFACDDATPARLVAAAHAGYDAVLVGVPASPDPSSMALLDHLTESLPPGAVLAYRDRLGQHASISATLAAVAARAVVEGSLPLGEHPLTLSHKRLLVVELGRRIAMFGVSA